MSKSNLGTEWGTGITPMGPAGTKIVTDPASVHARREPELTPMDYAPGFGMSKQVAPGVDRKVDLTITVAGEVTDE